MFAFFLCVALVALSIGSYCVWPSRWNVPAHLNLGFCIIAYVVPIYLSGALTTFQPALVRYCALIVSLGAGTYLLGLYCGIVGRPLAAVPLASVMDHLSPRDIRKFVERRTWLFAVAGLLGLGLSFAVMGFVPAFAAQPLAAKFFRGIYAAPYQRIEILYRTSYFILVAAVPLLFMAWVVTRRVHWALLTGVSVAMIALTLTRGPIASGVLLMLGLLAARKRRWTIAFILIIVLAYPVGALFYRLVGIVHYYRQDLWQSIASGSPDVSDLLNFMFHFLGRGEFTHGKTFWGGLIPGHYLWNPSIYSLMVISDNANLSRLVSGGLRLPAPVWGYTAFGWTGAALVPFVSGWIQARFIKFVRREGERRDLIRAAVIYLFYATVGIGISQFYILSIYSLPTFAVYGSFLYTLKPLSTAVGEDRLSAARHAVAGSSAAGLRPRPR